MSKSAAHYLSACSGLAILLLAALFCSLFVGDVSIPPLDILRGLFGAGDEGTQLVVQEIRLPRALIAIVVGSGLGLSGAAIQGWLRNPLAEPGVIGISGCAALGAVLCLYFGLASLTIFALPAGAIGGAVIAGLLLHMILSRDVSVLTLVLSGAALSSLAAALLSLALSLSPNPWALSEIVFWLLGSVKDRSMADFWLMIPFIATGSIMLMFHARSLDTLSLGQETAQSLGINLKHLRLGVTLGVALIIGASVAITGIIGFVGLIVPHIMRLTVTSVPSRLLLPSALGGAAFLLFADIIVRAISGPLELYLGVVTALFGAPFFLWIIMQTRREMR